MTRIIPGVQVTVVKEVVPPQLAPSGVLGLVGFTENTSGRTVRAASWSSFREACGPAAAYSMPEARLALENGVFELVVVPLESSAAAANTAIPAYCLSLTAKQAGVTAAITDETGTFKLTLTPNGGNQVLLPGLTLNTLKATLEANPDASALVTVGEVATVLPEPREYKLGKDKPVHIVSAFVTCFILKAKEACPQATITITTSNDTFDLKITPPPDKSTAKTENYTGLTLSSLEKELKSSTLVDVELPTALLPTAGSYTLEKDKPLPISATTNIALEARAKGTWANDLKLIVTHRADKFDLEIRAAAAKAGDAPLEVHRNLETATLASRLANDSALVKLKEGIQPAKPQPGEYTLLQGTDASAKEYIDALEWLKDEPDVDMVLAAIQDFSDADKVAKIYSGAISHCNNMSADSKGRIGFGQVPPNADLAASVQMANTLLSDRFVLLAPHGVVGAVAGRVGSLDYFQSPTFKTLTGLTALSRAIPLEEQSQLLQGYAVPVVNQRGRGVIVLRGLTTDGDQISVRRVADRAVRGVKMLGELFIGRLNNEEGRGALKQKLAEFLVQMQKDGALVPSTDGQDPAFVLNVYASQADFAQGIVRVDIAVRPVRAIDFIYATILVQV